jgi:hypothetical protein
VAHSFKCHYSPLARHHAKKRCLQVAAENAARSLDDSSGDSKKPNSRVAEDAVSQE